MKKLLVFQHVPFELLGSLNPLLKEAGFRIRYVNFGRHPDARPELDGYSGLVILGGPMSAYEVEQGHLATEVGLIRTALEKNLPVLGICLGAQLIAKALGAKVRPNRVPEIGWYGVSLTEEGRKDPLFSHFNNTETLFQWHADTFHIPRKAVRLAGSPDCRNQAFRFGDRVYGFQFHLEVDEPLIERWLSVPVHKAELKNLQPRVTAERIRRETPRNIQRLRSLSEKTFGGFVRLLGAPRRTVLLRSR